MTTVEFGTLERTSIEKVYEAFLEAFSDYLVRMDMPIALFETMLTRRGYDPRRSMGAFHEDRLVGMVLNGVREWQGYRTAYDTGTGIVPDFRRQGLTTEMFQRLLDMLRGEGVERYLLEVITDNAPAEDLYRKHGFRVVRELACYIGERASLTGTTAAGIELVPSSVGDLDRSLLGTFLDFHPSWQNSVDSILAVPDMLAAVMARTGGETVGFGVVQPGSGDVPLLAVREDARRSGVGGAIFGHLMGQVEGDRVAVLNVDAADPGANGFCAAMGLDRYVSQYEMMLDL